MSDFGIDVDKASGGLAWLVLRNPERLNAIRLEMWQAIPDALARLGEDPDVRVVVVRGHGKDAFASGADISEFETHRKDARSAAAYEQVTARAFDALTAFPKPLVAMVTGVCVGGGCAIAASTDLRIASSGAKFALPPARLGLGYHFKGIQRLVQLVGPGTAAEILFTARQYSAEDFHRLGFVNQVVPPSELEQVTLRTASAIAANAPLSLMAAKRAIVESLRDGSERDLDAVQRLIAHCFESEDYAEGVRAFLEKRRPEFKGR